MHDVRPFVEKHFRWNFGVNVADNSLYALASSLISRQTIMPLLVSMLTDSTIAVGLIPAITSLMFYMPQLFVANHAEQLKRKKPFVLLVSGLLQRLPYFLIGIAVLMFAQESPNIALVSFFILLGTSAMGGGVVTPAWFTLIGSVIPVNRRGIFFGLADGSGMLLGTIGAFLAGVTLEEVAYPLNFAMLFFLASILMLFSWLFFSLTREPVVNTIKKPNPIRHYFRQLPTILRQNHNFRRYLITYSLNRIGMMAVGFFIVYGDERFSLSGVDVGLLTAVLIGSQAVSHLVLGWAGDRFGHKLNLLISAGMIGLTAFLVIVATNFTVLIIAFVCLGIVLGSDNVSKLSIVLEFAVPEDQPTFIGLTNTLLAPVTFTAPIVGGWIAVIFGFHTMFLITMIFGIFAVMLWLSWVKEPRHLTPQPITTDAIG